MRVINCTTKKVYEVGLFENPCWEGALKIRVLELPLVFGNLGTDVGFLEMWEGLDKGRRRLLQLRRRCAAIFRSRSRCPS